MSRPVNREDYWETADWGPEKLGRREYRLCTQFYGGLSAFWAASDTAEPSLSLATCEKVHTSEEPGEPSGGFDGSRGGLCNWERDALRTAYRHDIGAASIDGLAEAIKGSPDAAEAIMAVMGREVDRQENVVGLLQEGEVAHALRLATCGQKSVQLECPDTFGAGGCGHEENYVPISCDSRLCPDCGSRRQGKAMERYGGVVEEWGAPTALRLSLPERVEATEEEIGGAVDQLREAFGKLRRRVIPASGSYDGRRWVWDSDGGEPAHHYWKPALKAEATRRAREEGDRSLFAEIARWEREYVEEGRGIPVEELMGSGIYGIDAKQSRDDGTVNVHLHALVDCPYIPQAALSSVWGDLTGAPVVDVRRVTEQGERGRETALMETVGYAAKPPQYETLDAAVAYVRGLKGSKLIQPFGGLHGNTPEVEAQLVCARCENTPAWWNYLGVTDDRLDTMGATWSDPSADDGPPD